MVLAKVPGAVQVDWALAHGWGDPAYATDVERFAWMEDVYWLYRAKLPHPNIEGGQRLVFVCNGVDYRFQVRMDGQVLHGAEGMFTPFEIDLTGRVAPGSQIEVLIFPAPKSHTRGPDRQQANQCCKPAVSYGWDFHPRLIPLGIWDDTYLEVRPACHLQGAELLYEMSDDLSSATVRVQVDVAQVASDASRAAVHGVRWRLYDHGGGIVLEDQQPVALPAGDGLARVLFEAVVPHPQLWWPNGQGEPVLYGSIVELFDGQGAVVERKASRVGFRRVRLVMHPDQWRDPDVASFPKGPNKPPITLEVNGRPIFAKGSNWVTPDIFAGRVTADAYRQQLDLVRDAHFSLLRCNGVAGVQKEAFFDLCDERGIMVWQEFPLACNRYEGTPHYLKVLDQESRSIIRRLRSHACVVLWCGGNELFNDWSRMTPQDAAMRLLDHNCYALDPQRPFLMTSPTMGMGHGSYLFKVEDGREVFQYFHESRCTAYTEFGVPSPSGVEILRRIIPPADLFPPKPQTAWELRHAFRAWAHDSWLEWGRIEEYFGKCPDLEQMVQRGQLLQSEGLKCIFEEARRQKPRCSMALNWCFNEPWPSAAGSCLVNWPCAPKPALQSVKAACRPVLASARISRFSWQPGETLEAELWLLNDSPEVAKAGRIEAYLQYSAQRAQQPQELLLLIWEHPDAPANQNLAGPTARVKLPESWRAGRLRLVLRVPHRRDWESEYELVLRPGEGSGGA